MTHRHLAAATLVMAVAMLAPAGAGAQSQAGETSGWTSPSTAWGDPDLQGRWTNTTTTPLQRPADLEGRELLTEEERAALDEAGDVAREQRGVSAGTGETGSYNNFWVERGVRMARTSLIVDPPTAGCRRSRPSKRRAGRRARAIEPGCRPGRKTATCTSAASRAGCRAR